MNRRAPSSGAIALALATLSLACLLHSSVRALARADEVVTLKTATGTLTGALVTPSPGDRTPAVLILSSADAIDRDENPGGRSRTGDRDTPLALALAARGIASLRMDQRGAIESRAAGHAQDLGLETNVSNAAAWIEYLRNDPRFTTIVVESESDASPIGARAARAARADGVVSIAAAVDGTQANVHEAIKTSDPAAGRQSLTIPSLTLQGARAAQIGAAETTTRSADVADRIARFVSTLPSIRRPIAARVSLRDVVLGTVDGVHVTIEYARPSTRGRAIWGALVPWNRWWMPGADEATTLTTSADIRLGDLAVPAGDYTLYTMPADPDFQLIVNKALNQFHTVYHPEQDLGRAAMVGRPVDHHVEQLTFAIDRAQGPGSLRLQWNDREYVVAIQRLAVR